MKVAIIGYSESIGLVTAARLAAQNIEPVIISPEEAKEMGYEGEPFQIKDTRELIPQVIHYPPAPGFSRKDRRKVSRIEQKEKARKEMIRRAKKRKVERQDAETAKFFAMLQDKFDNPNPPSQVQPE